MSSEPYPYLNLYIHRSQLLCLRYFSPSLDPSLPFLHSRTVLSIWLLRPPVSSSLIYLHSILLLKIYPPFSLSLRSPSFSFPYPAFFAHCKTSPSRIYHPLRFLNCTSMGDSIRKRPKYTADQMFFRDDFSEIISFLIFSTGQNPNSIFSINFFFNISWVFEENDFVILSGMRKTSTPCSSDVRFWEKNLIFKRISVFRLSNVQWIILIWYFRNASGNSHAVKFEKTSRVQFCWLDLKTLYVCVSPNSILLLQLKHPTSRPFPFLYLSRFLSASASFCLNASSLREIEYDARGDINQDLYTLLPQ